jgi:hypothetical protein
MLSATAFFGGALVTIYAMSTGQDAVIGNLLTWNLRRGPNLTGVLGAFVGAGISFFLLALLFDFIRWVNVTSRSQESPELQLTLHLLKPVVLSGEEQESIFGDIVEEFNQFPSKTEARLWLFSQLVKFYWQIIVRAAKK